jgi:hypothetical protein
VLHYGGRGGNATPEGTDQVQPRGASSRLPSGTRAQRSVLPGRGKAASIAQRRRTGQRAQGTQKEAGRGTDRRGKKGRPGRPTRGSVGGQLAKQCMQLPTGVGASRRRHLPGSRQGGPAVPAAFLVLLGAREGSSVARSVRCRGGLPSPGTPGRQQVAEPVSAGGLPATTTASASRGDTCTAQGGAGGSSTGSQARQQVAGKQGNAGQGGEGPEQT